jgi:Tfp pilus assembly protein PilF
MKESSTARILRIVAGVAVALVFLIGTSVLRRESRYSDWLARGKAHTEAGNVDSAFLAYGTAIHMRPDQAEGYFLRAAAMLKLNSFNKAQVDLNDVIRMRPDFGEAYRLRALCYRAQGLQKKAAEDDATADRLGAPKVITDPEKVVVP